MKQRHPWKPRCAIRIGVVGNRRFAAEGMKTLAARALDEVWKEIFTSVTVVLGESYHGRQVRELFSGEAPRVAVLSSLAAGGDQLCAAAALNAITPELPLAVELEALLPFAEEFYPGPAGSPRPEFTEDEAKELRRLMAASKQVVRLDGDYSDEETRRNGYRQAADLLLQNSDIVIAVYDPDAARGKAGTVETVQSAAGYHTPVINIHVRRDAATVHVAKGGLDSNVRQCIREQLLLPELLTARGNTTVSHALDRLQMVGDFQRTPWLCRNRPLGAIFGAAWRTLRALTSSVASSRREEELRHTETLREPKDAVVLPPYSELYQAASVVADAYMRTYRGAFVLSYFLAGLAVAAAVTMMLAMILTGGHPSHALMFVLCIVKIAIIVVLLWLEKAGREFRLHEAAVDFRYLVELIRPMQWLSAAGVYPPAVDLPLHAPSDDLRRSWMAWLVRAVARSTPSVSANGNFPKEIDMTPESDAAILDRARTEWIEGQVVYHRRNSARMEALAEGSERGAKTLLWIVLVAAVVACVLEQSNGGEITTATAAVLGTIAAILPAFIAALSGIAFQSEAKRLAKRSEAMAGLLQERQTELDRIAALRRNHTANHADVAETLKKVSAITLNEVADWKILYQVHEIRAS